MWYQLKSIFRNSITWTVLAIIIMLNLYTIINLEREAYNFNSRIVSDLELTNICAKESQVRSKSGVKAIYSESKYWEASENYEKLRDWIIKHN